MMMKMKMTTFSAVVLLACCITWTAAQDRIEEIKPISYISTDGLVRSADDIQREEEIPFGCSVSSEESETDYRTVTCDAKIATTAEYNSKMFRWWWHDGNCCCPSYRYLRCPKKLLVGNMWYEVAHFGGGSQCWTESYCSSSLRGVCPTKCQPVKSTRTVLVHYGGEIKWVHYSYNAGCRCTTCSGGYCKGNLYGVSLLG